MRSSSAHCDQELARRRGGEGGEGGGGRRGELSKNPTTLTWQGRSGKIKSVKILICRDINENFKRDIKNINKDINKDTNKDTNYYINKHINKDIDKYIRIDN